MKRTDSDRPLRSRGQLQLTGEGIIWLVAGFVLGGLGWYKNINIVLILAYLMAALLLVNALLASVHCQRVTSTREPTAPLYAGETVTLRLTVRNRGRGPATVSVVDDAGGTPVSWLVHRLARGESALCVTRRVFPVRGCFSGTPISISTGFPLGLLSCVRSAGDGADLVVLPALGVADPIGLRRWVLLQLDGDGRARRVLRRITTDEAEVRGVRPFRPGDAIRSVHWRSSARRGELMVREYDTAPAPDLLLVLEPWLPRHPTTTDRAALEAALSLAVTVAQTWAQEAGARVTVALAGDATSVRTAADSEAAVREALAPLASVVGGHDFDALPPAALGRSVARTARILVSSRRQSPYASALAAATGRPFLALSPADALFWYQPPPSVQHVPESSRH